jgi:hypothetical protein
MQYKQCLGVSHLSNTCLLESNRNQKVLKARGIDTMLEEAREDNRENDAQHLRGNCKFTY